ncbi:hypothetical protein C2G38_2049014 [Gigaspora rosea]|uniref:DNA-directed DNA polymerase n=1 Tax=Gigaspora rosea TaxID=44941 RepID=A0A397U413_9GLOM|nr:hypothetical protein C2G38_2049014 [Gigaspora rosea]
MNEVRDINNERSLHKIVEDVLRDAITNPNQWDFEQFIETDAWKPNVNNQSVQRFIGRIRRKYESKIPIPGERFSYVVTHPDMTFDLHGRKLNPTKGEKMEFADIAKELKKELDLYHYYEKTIIGLCARFIMYDKKYEPALLDKIMQIEDPDEKYKQIDDYAQKKAKLWLERFVKESIIINGITSKMMESRGRVYQRTYRNAVKKAQEMLYQQYIDFEPSEIRLPITEEDVQEFRKIIADQEKMTDIVMDEYRFLLRYGHNSKGEFPEPPNEIFSLQIVTGMICSEEALELSGSLFFSPPLFAYESVLSGPSG